MQIQPLLTQDTASPCRSTAYPCKKESHLKYCLPLQKRIPCFSSYTLAKTGQKFGYTSREYPRVQQPSIAKMVLKAANVLLHPTHTVSRKAPAAVAMRPGPSAAPQATQQAPVTERDAWRFPSGPHAPLPVQSYGLHQSYGAYRTCTSTVGRQFHSLCFYSTSLANSRKWMVNPTK